MPQDNLSYDDYCRIIGGIYLDAYIRIQSLEQQVNILKNQLSQADFFGKIHNQVSETTCLSNGNENSM